MPGLVGGFGKYAHSYSFLKVTSPFLSTSCWAPQNYRERLNFKSQLSLFSNKNNQTISSTSSENRSEGCAASSPSSVEQTTINYSKTQIGPYLAGLIEGDGTIAVHDTKSKAKKYSPIIIIVFKKADLPLANYLQNLINCGRVFIKPERGYVLWQIQDLVSVFTVLSIINDYMRTPKIEAKDRAIDWLNNYIIRNNNSKLPSTISILSKIHTLESSPLDTSPIQSNSWLTGFSDADANFSINIHKRKNKNSTRVQLYYRLEIKQNYHSTKSSLSVSAEPSSAPIDDSKASFFPIMSKIGMYLGVTVYSRSKVINDKIFHSFTVISHNKNSNFKITDYFNKFPLLSSKYLDYKDWAYILDLQNSNTITTSYLDKAVKIRSDFNSTRSTYSWKHLNDCHLEKNKE